MSWSVIQRKVVDPAEVAGSTGTITFDSTTTAGSLLAVFVAMNYGGTRGNFTLRDSASRTFTEPSGAFANGNFSNLTDIHGFYYINHPGGITTLTLTTDQNDFTYKAYAVEVSGILTSGAFDAAHAAVNDPSGTGTDAISSGSLTTTATNDFLVAFTYDGDHASPGTGTLSAGTGFTSAAGDVSGAICRGEYRNVSTASSVAGTFTHSAAGVHLTSAMAFKEVPTTTVNLTGQSVTSATTAPTVTAQRSVNVTSITGQASTSATTAPTVTATRSVSPTLSGRSVTLSQGIPSISSNYLGYYITASIALQTVDSIFANMGFAPADSDISYWPTTAVNGTVLVPEISGGSITGRISTGPQTGTFTAIYYRLSNNTFYDWVVTLVDGTVTSIVLVGQQITSSSGSSFVRVDISKGISGPAITAQQGTVSVTTTASPVLSGRSITSQQGSISVTTNTATSVSLVGQGMTLSQGSVSASGNASPTLTGQQISVGRGNVTVQASAANATVNLTGQAITTGTSDVRGVSNVTPYYITYHNLEYVLGNTNR